MLSVREIVMKLFERTLTARRILILLGGIIILYIGIDMLYYSYLPFRGGRTYTETRGSVILVVGLMWWMWWMLLKDLYFDIYPLERFKFHKMSDLKYINIDLLKNDDTEWINELKKQSANEEKLIAYSKEGSIAAKAKAQKLNLEKYFIDFIDYAEIRNHRHQHKDI